MSLRVVSVGDLVVDLITPVRLPIQPFQHQEVRGMKLEPGGGCNFNILARRLGLEVLAIGAIGDDAFGAQLVRMLEQEGIDLRGVAIMPGSTTTVVYDLIDLTTHEHVFIGCHADGPDVPYTPAIDAIVASGDALFLQGYNLQERQIQGIILPALERGRAADIPIFFDVGPTVRHTPFERVRDVMTRADCLLLTEDEVPLAAEGRTGADAYAFLLNLGPHTLVIKQGAAGCTLIRRDETFAVPGFRVPVLDTVGAGDCFDAAFIYGRLRGLGWRDCAVLGNAAGAASVQKVGAGRSVPTCAEVQAVLALDPSSLSLAC